MSEWVAFPVTHQPKGQYRRSNWNYYAQLVSDSSRTPRRADAYTSIAQVSGTPKYDVIVPGSNVSRLLPEKRAFIMSKQSWSMGPYPEIPEHTEVQAPPVRLIVSLLAFSVNSVLLALAFMEMPLETADI